MAAEQEWKVVSLKSAAPPPAEGWEIFYAMVFDRAGCQGLEEPPVHGGPFSAKLFFLPDCEKPDQRVLELLGQALPHHPFDLTIENVPNQDWGNAWREYFHWNKVGARTYVGPPWEQPPKADCADPIMVRIEPAQAFGTGSHETTQLCLKVMEELPMKGAVVLDMGTGSGILAIAAAKLGARVVVGVEYDPVCEENFHLNAELNDTVDPIHFVLGAVPGAGLEFLPKAGADHFTLAVCNMLSERFAPHLGALRALGCPLLLSGYLSGEREAVEALAAKAGYAIARRYNLGDWCASLCEPTS